MAMESVRLLQSLKCHGLAYVEFKRDTRTGEYFLKKPKYRQTCRSVRTCRG